MALRARSIEQLWHDAWGRFDNSYRKASIFVVSILVLAYGFEMTNLTLHHDDVIHIFIQDDILGHYLGRFGFGPLHLYLQNAYIMPFVQVTEGILFLTAYGLIVANFWGARKPLDIVLISAIMGVFPYMGQIYQYNTSIAPFSLAHLLGATAVVLSTRGSVWYVALAAVFYAAAFSIYQSVIANAATIFCIWLLTKSLFPQEEGAPLRAVLLKRTTTAALAVCGGGLLYLGIVSNLNLQFDSYQAAGEAFSLSGIWNVSESVERILQNTRASLFWPESYFPAYLKHTQLAFLVLAAAVCFWLPKTLPGKTTAMALLTISLFAPRILQLLHPSGTFHNLTLTAYGVTVAGFIMVINRSGATLLRNFSSLLSLFLIGAFILQCNWISTVNYLNTMAHVSTLTQVLARARSLPDVKWDGKTIAVVGRLNMESDYPYKPETGVATEFMDAAHMERLARLMRDHATFVPADETIPKALDYAAVNEPWPHPSSVGVVDGVVVVVLSKDIPKTTAH